MSKSLQLPLFTEDLKVVECLILIKPPQNVIDYIAIVRNEIESEYGKFPSHWSESYITLSNLLIIPDRIETALSNVTDRLSRFYSFEISLNGFSVLEERNTLFIDMEPSYAFRALTDEFAQIKKDVLKNTKLYHSQHPPLTIARKMNSWVIQKLKKKYVGKPFHYVFDAKKKYYLSKNIPLIITSHTLR